MRKFDNFCISTITKRLVCRNIEQQEDEQPTKTTQLSHESLSANIVNRLFKIRPLIEALNKTFNRVPKIERLCIDEQICLTKKIKFFSNSICLTSHILGATHFS